MNRLVAAGVSIVCFAGCDPEPQAPSPDENFPVLTLAIGGEVREIPFAVEKCTDESPVRRIELLAPDEVADAQGRPYVPHVFIARLNGDEVLEAHAFGTNTPFAGHDYPLIEAIAKKLPNHPEPDCRVEVNDGLTTITCNETTVVPWLARGPRPHPSFKVSFRCD